MKSIRKAPASPHLIRREERCGNPIVVLGKKLRVTLSDMPLTLAVQLDLDTQIGAREKGLRGVLLSAAKDLSTLGRQPASACTRRRPRLADPQESR